MHILSNSLFLSLIFECVVVELPFFNRSVMRHATCRSQTHHYTPRIKPNPAVGLIRCRFDVHRNIYPCFIVHKEDSSKYTAVFNQIYKPFHF